MIVAVQTVDLHKETDRQTNREKETDRQIDRDRQTDRQRGREREREREGKKTSQATQLSSIESRDEEQILDAST